MHIVPNGLAERARLAELHCVSKESLRVLRALYDLRDKCGVAASTYPSAFAFRRSRTLMLGLCEHGRVRASGVATFVPKLTKHTKTTKIASAYEESFVLIVRFVTFVTPRALLHAQAPTLGHDPAGAEATQRTDHIPHGFLLTHPNCYIY
jgi:hypothetical protein